MSWMSILMFIIGMIAGNIMGIFFVSLFTIAEKHSRDQAQGVLEKGEQNKFSSAKI